MAKWICDGQPKNGKSYPNCAGPHEPYENYGPDCVQCGLPQEAMQRSRGKTGTGGKLPPWLLPGAIAAGVIAVIGGLGWFWLRPQPDSSPVTDNSPVTTPTPTIDPQIANLVSTGEKILLDSTTAKNAGATAYGQQNWSEAIAQYQQAVQENPNDPESKIYLNNAQAAQQGNPLAIAAVVPVATDANAAKEILRGIAQYQDEYNQGNPPRLLQVNVVNQNAANRGLASSLAQSLIDRPEILGIIGYGADASTRLAMQTYESAKLAVLSPVNTQVDGNSLKLISINQSTDKLVEEYLDSVAKTLMLYAKTQQSNPQVAIFYNSDSDYSNNLKQSILTVLPDINGQGIAEFDVSDSNYNTQTAVEEAKAAGATVLVVALSKDKVPVAIEIAEANQQSLLLLGGDEMYNPDILVQGQDQISGMVLAVPWSSQAGDTFAQEALQLWKGKVSWRTKTAYDATQVMTEVITQNPSRNDIYQNLQQGIEIDGSKINFSIFNEVPLVQATPGNHGPQGSTHGFTAL